MFKAKLLHTHTFVYHENYVTRNDDDDEEEKERDREKTGRLPFLGKG